MSYWSFYFLAKVGLHYAGYLSLHWLLNLLLAVVVFWPLQSRLWKSLRLAVGLIAAIALLYYDTHFPPISRVLSQVSALAGFSASYMLELVQRVVSWQALLGFVVLLALYSVLARRIRFATFALLAILSVPLVTRLQQGPAKPVLAQTQDSAQPAAAAPAATPDALLANFYASEHQRRLNFASGTTPPFDIVLLHVCSLAWDDMEFEGMRNTPLLQRFDAVFTQFNSAASYSGPAQLRVLHGSCGQMPHEALYEGTDAACNVFPSLEQVGYHTSALLNHNGVFDGFAQSLQERGGFAGKMEKNQGAPEAMQSFDGSPVYSDLALLSQWWKERQSRGSEPVALYYNTITLHDGNRVPGIASRNSLQTYKPRLTQLLSDFDRFISVLESSGRPVLLMLVPEHGASLRGDKMQISGMREIPGPRVTLVPTAIKLIGLPHPAGATGAAPAGQPSAQTGPVIVSKPTSYFDLFTLVNNLMQDSPYRPGATPLADRVAQLHGTRFVAENADVVVMHDDSGQYLLKSGTDAWIPYTN